MTIKLNDKVKAARKFASMLHDGQLYGELPYTTHLEETYLVLLGFGVVDRDILAAALLHDAMEDTGVSKACIEEIFGEDVAILVAAVTDEPGANRKERKAKTYPKIRNTSDAVLIKLADRIANIEHAKAAVNIRMFKMYAKEAEEFRTQLRGAATEYTYVVEDMWRHLEQVLRDEPAIPKPQPVAKET